MYLAGFFITSFIVDKSDESTVDARSQASSDGTGNSLNGGDASRPGQTIAVQALQRAERLYNAGDFPAAFQAYREAAEGGSPRPLYQAGLMLHNGIGVTQDYESGRRLLESAAQAGDVDAMHYLGCCYGNGGTAFPKDHAKSLDYLRRAADAGHADALADLGNAYYFGSGVAKDVGRAHALYKQAIAKGSSVEELPPDSLGPTCPVRGRRSPRQTSPRPQ